MLPYLLIIRTDSVRCCGYRFTFSVFFFLVSLSSTDETATENILKAELTMASLCGRLGLVTPRDAFITAICKASLPPHYALTVLSSNAANLSSKGAALQLRIVILLPSFFRRRRHHQKYLIARTHLDKTAIHLEDEFSMRICIPAF